MKLFFCSVLIGVVTLGVTGCSNTKKEKKDDILAGVLQVAVDETVLPLFLEQKEVFESSYYNAKIDEHAKPEVQVVNSLLNGDVAFAVLTRQLTEDERKGFEARSIRPRIYNVAYDGIILVGNVNDADTSAKVSDVIELMKGNKAQNYSLIFDNLNSSVFRYFRELGKIDKVASVYVEAKGSADAVLREVAEKKGKVGLISYNQFLSLESSFSEKDKIRILSVVNEQSGERKFVKPSQTSLATGEYPLKREIFVLNYQPNMGLGIGFSAFMTGDRGQRIVLKSGLLPYTMPGREIIIRDKIN
ncbi:PstS family phosphate ABC transporter substrate-binding protein [Sphingobacterium faecale]|uniref:Substrate-binding domain-containing protein n=1 Tax=Sphingobacterium faecale TaxID=2803775 RepID=A0ABS1R740_9SPHI|nr:substrate-binding domain-containing protein [Sphingobacterium faecale]MBL1410513.1 substrate-binding domain-containing protein [Sphingobacterium faecale]